MSNKNRFIIGTVIGVVAVGTLYSFNKSGSNKTSVNSPSDLTSVVDTMVDVTVPLLSKSEQNGEINFLKYCSACHGTNAAGQNGVAPPLIHKIYEPNHHGDIAFQLAAERGVRAHHWQFGNMPPLENVKLSEIKSITLYIRAVQRANGIF